MLIVFQKVIYQYVESSFNMFHSILNTLKRHRGKDDLEILSHQDVVYKITCNDCDATYIGQTKRQLRTSLRHEHVININQKSGSLSVISNHRLENDHEMNWNDVKIVDNEPS